MPHPSINTRSLILLWAFAESGIGGILHGLKLPFTGIFVGGIAVICIALLGFYGENNKNSILKALAIVLMVKLTVSPHSPWQAYVAVVFQGYLGHLIFRNTRYFSAKTIIFSMICLLESAVQKILISLLIYGVTFFKAIDSSAQSIGKSFGFAGEGSVVFLIFGVYVLLYLMVGLIIGIWVPSIPKQVFDLAQIMPEINVGKDVQKNFYKKQGKSVFIGFFVLALVLLAIHIFVPSMKLIELSFIFLRAIIVSLGLIFIVGPIFLHLIRRYSKGLTIEKKLLNEILDEIPVFTNKAYLVLHWVNKEYRGWTKIKNMVLGLLVIGQTQNEPMIRE
jgi:hypothetical protein